MQSNTLAREMNLSISAAGTLSECEHKFCRKYVAKCPADSDYVDPVYFKFGRAAHSVVEWANYDSKNCTKAMVEKAVAENGLDWTKDAPKIMVTLPHYWLMQWESKTVPVAFEVWFENDLAKGKVDGILKEPDNSGFWIVENKWIGTKLDIARPTTIKTDPQTCQYAAFSDLIAKRIGLDIPFLGVRFREIEKPRQKYKAGETWEQFLRRLLDESNIHHRELVVPESEIKWDQEYQNFLGKLKRARELQREFLMGKPIEEIGLRNRANCVKWGSPCQFWSTCNDGILYTVAKGKAAPQSQLDLSFL